MVPVHTKVEEEEPAELPEVEAAEAPPPNEAEEQEQTRQAVEREQQIAEKEMLKAPQYLDSFVKQDLISEEEVVSLRGLYSVNERLKKGEIDPEEAECIRNSMDEAVRQKLDERLRQAVDYGVLYLNVFEALKRIPEDRDEILKFMIRNKRMVITQDTDIDLSPVIKPLEEDQELLNSAIQIVERKDQEVRMISANMPPYRCITSDNEKVGNMMSRRASSTSCAPWKKTSSPSV